jgi:hypothetical protein
MDVLKMKKFLSRSILFVICIATLFFCVRQAIDPNSYINRFISRTPSSLIAQASTSLVAETPTVVKPDPIIIVREIRKLARLETASADTEQVVPGERNPNQLWGALGEKMIFVAYGSVVAGVDLSNFTKNDIVIVNPTTVEVKLPKAEIFSVTLNKDSHVASRDKGIFASTDKDMETRVRQQAEVDCENDALDQGILDKANANAKDFFMNFLQSFGFKNVSFTSN